MLKDECLTHKNLEIHEKRCVKRKPAENDEFLDENWIQKRWMMKKDGIQCRYVAIVDWWCRDGTEFISSSHFQFFFTI